MPSHAREFSQACYTGELYGVKFKQELNGKQVKKLLSSFRPLTASSGQPAPQAVANIPLPRAIPPLAIQNQFKHIPYIPQPVNPQTAPRSNYLQHGYNRTAAYVERVPPTLHHQSLLATSRHYVAHGLQQPTYSRHRAIEESSSHKQLPSLERFRPVEQRTSHVQVTNSARQYPQTPLHRETLYQNNAAAYNSNPTASARYTSSASQSQAPSLYDPLPSQRGPLYQDNVAQAQYASSAGLQPQAPTQSRYASAIMQPQVSGHYHQLPSQRETIYQNNVGAYSSYSAAPAQYTSSITPTERLTLPGISQGSDPVLPSYYSYAGANHLSR